MIWAVPTVPIWAGVAKFERTMSGTSEPRMMKSMTSKNSPAVTIAKHPPVDPADLGIVERRIDVGDNRLRHRCPPPD